MRAIIGRGKDGYSTIRMEEEKPLSSDAVLDDVRELVKCCDHLKRILLYDDKVFHSSEMIEWQKHLEKVRAHIV